MQLNLLVHWLYLILFLNVTVSVWSAFFNIWNNFKNINFSYLLCFSLMKCLFLNLIFDYLYLVFTRIIFAYLISLLFFQGLDALDLHHKIKFFYFELLFTNSYHFWVKFTFYLLKSISNTFECHSLCVILHICWIISTFLIFLQAAKLRIAIKFKISATQKFYEIIVGYLVVYFLVTTIKSYFCYFLLSMLS